MEDKEKQIEEMAKVICFNKCKYCENCYFLRLAEKLYDAGCRKPHKNTVVLSTQEYLNTVTKVREEFEYEYKDKVVLSKEEYEELLKVNKADLAEQATYTRKETAEKFAKAVKDRIKQIDKFYSEEIIDMSYNGISANEIDELAKQFGVEIKE